MEVDTLIIHNKYFNDEISSIVQPIFLSTTFESRKNGDFIYSRRDNPIRQTLENILMTLEEGIGCSVYSSGCAALFSLFMSLDYGSHIIVPKDAFFITRRMLGLTFERLKWLKVSYVDPLNSKELKSAINSKTKLILVESPTNPLLRIVKVNEIASISNKKGILLACDNTLATPIFQQPLKLGADIVVMSTTKYLCGHTDATGGAIVWKSENNISSRLKQSQGDWGAILSPFDSWLILRGLKTLSVRICRQSNTAIKITRFLSKHPNVSCVYYPGLNKKIHNRIYPFGGLISFQIRGTEEQAKEITRKVKLFKCATSFGGPESLIEHRLSTEGENSKVPKNLLRLSVGLENENDLIKDLKEALKY